MNSYVFLAAYGLADDLVRCYDTANGDGLTWLLYLHSQRPDVVAACERLAERRNVIYLPYGENRGMSRSINEAIDCAHDLGVETFVALNDDVLCPYSRVVEMVNVALDNPQASHVEVFGYTECVGKATPLGFSCVAWNMRAFETVGFFDEYFDPFYFMDCDWRYRARLLGLPPLVLNMPDVVHAGSKTRTHVAGASDWMSGAFENAKALYLAKWGGDQELETYRTPFNEDYGLQIGYAERHDPYPAHRPAYIAQVTP